VSRTHGALALVEDEDPFRRILDRLRSVGSTYRLRPDGQSARAKCPAHHDQKPSLLVTCYENKVVVKCFGGCVKRDVLARLGLTYGDLYYGPRVRQVSQVVAKYPYTDVDVQLIAEKVRLSPKGFRWRVPDPATADGWRWGLDGRSVGLYRLPDLVDARQVLVTEGEKAVERLRLEGFAATCPPAGANSWLDTYSVTLWQMGCVEVVVLPDADQAGRGHAERVAASCHGVAAPQSDDLGSPLAGGSGRIVDAEMAPLKVKVVSLDVPAGGDVVDYLETHSARQLRDLIVNTPYWYPGCDDERRRERRRQQTRERVRRYRARNAQPCNAANVSVEKTIRCNAAYVRDEGLHPVTRNAVTHPERTSDHFTNTSTTYRRKAA
jgi:hypothetical protein